MKTIGILGGMSYESTAFYYKIINEEVNRRLGGLHSAKILLSSVDFDEIKKMQNDGNWTEAAAVLSAEAKKLQNAGADFIIISTNTMHKVAPEIAQNISVPLLHIAGPTARKIKEDGLKKIGLLGTKFTMEHNFYTDILRREGLEILTPDAAQRETVHNIIFDELCKGVVKNSSRKKYLEIIDSLKERGAEGVILGCTEICMLLKTASLPLYDTTAIHAKEAAHEALK
ncbi:MAG: aspartate/glutamate racemase family protein [Elusimicrobia bacterium]|nr:aspartate/glutamate racemase family protein [Elusimicrobiota bacterium]